MVIPLGEESLEDALRFVYLIEATDFSGVPTYQAKRTASFPNFSPCRDVHSGDFLFVNPYTVLTVGDVKVKSRRSARYAQVPRPFPTSSSMKPPGSLCTILWVSFSRFLSSSPSPPPSLRVPMAESGLIAMTRRCLRNYSTVPFLNTGPVVSSLPLSCSGGASPRYSPLWWRRWSLFRYSSSACRYTSRRYRRLLFGRWPRFSESSVEVET